MVQQCDDVWVVRVLLGTAIDVLYHKEIADILVLAVIVQCWKFVVQHCEDVKTVQALLVMMIGAP